MEEKVVPLLLSVTNRREYLYSIEGKQYYYLMDAALWPKFFRIYRKSWWKGFNFVKKNGKEIYYEKRD